MSQLFVLPFQTPFNSSRPLGLAKLYFYAATTTTHQPVYTTAALSVEHDQPVRSDAAGNFPPIYLNPAAAADYRIQLKTAADALVDGGDVDNIPRTPISQTEFDALQTTSPPFKRTAGEIAASVVPVNYAYLPGDIRRYGAALDNSTDDIQAFLDCLASNGYVSPWVGRAKITTSLIFDDDNYAIYGYRGVSELSYTGSAIAIDFNGKDDCTVDGITLYTPNSTKAVFVGEIAHNAKVTNCNLRGSSTGNKLSGTHNTGVGIELDRTFYVDISGNDISAYAKGIHGLHECNGNYIGKNWVRRCNRGIHMTDATTNSDGCQIVDNEIEGGEAGDLYAIDIQGGSNMMVRSNRCEYSPNGTAHIFVHDGAGDAVRHSIHDNRCVGTVAVSVQIGDDSGSNRLSANSLKDGWYSGTILIGQDADYTVVDLGSGRFIAGGAGSVSASLTDNSTTTILSILEDQAFTLSLTGCTTVPTVQVIWTSNKNIITAYLGTASGTSNSTACTLGTGVGADRFPALICPQSTRNFLSRILDNSASAPGTDSLSTGGVLTLSNTVAGGGAMTNGGTKGRLSNPLTYPRNG